MFDELGGQRWEHRHIPPPKKIPARPTQSFWPDEHYFNDMDYLDPYSLEEAWVARAMARHTAILEKMAVPQDYGNSVGYQNNNNLTMKDRDVNGAPYTDWIMSAVDKHIVKRIHKIADLPFAMCPCCQFGGSLYIKTDTRYDGKEVVIDEGTGLVACAFCDIDDVVIVGHQQFVGDFFSKDRQPIDDVLFKVYSHRPVPSNTRIGPLGKTIHEGWLNDDRDDYDWHDDPIPLGSGKKKKKTGFVELDHLEGI
jgi:hypothetical protein